LKPDKQRPEEGPEPDLGDVPQRRQRDIEREYREGSGQTPGGWRRSSGSDDSGEHVEKGGPEPEKDLGDDVVKHSNIDEERKR
jgi:hypothetical protein